MVNISYGHGFFDDGVSTTGWALTLGGAEGTHTIENGDYHKIEVTNPVGTVYISYPDLTGGSNLTLSSKKIYWRCKTGGGGIKAQVAVYYNDTYIQVVYPEASPTKWTAGSATLLTTHGTVDHVLLYANGAKGYVLYDFVLICEGTFTFPNAPRISLNPLGRDAILEPPSRYGDIDQTLGNKSATVDITCDLDVGGDCGDWKRPQGINPATGKCYVKDDKVNGQVFLDIWHNRGTEPWQWLSFNGFSFKAKLASCPFEWSGDSHSLPLSFREYRLSGASGETVVERLGLNNP